jgi:hypothetical protein
MELGLLYKVERNPDRARKHLEQALAVAQSERATGMVDKITTELLTMTSVRATLYIWVILTAGMCREKRLGKSNSHIQMIKSAKKETT